ncbi:ATP-binding cassette domain-containing protein [Actinophytocola gossypii]|uniref:ATP-binding cassette domain-containing protein n=1 Tax=Actinophytocola gossypii TaxID=2812003 RepID=A0ABT2J292_9PSEU|nr:ATP-binding cassette domain-containing protein [Actinophytocola gossypii]MCT2581960.1 ATP-binding cassette domain-containing protein [Actinophytocola gossypii]
MTVPAVADRLGRTGRPRIVLSCQGLRVTAGRTVLVDDLCFDVRAGEIYGLVGAEGAGKSTVLRAVSGLVSADAGTVVLGGHRLDRLDVSARTRLVGHAVGDAVILPSATVIENLSFWARVLGRDRVGHVVPAVRLGEYADVAVDRCSAAVRRALGLAVALLPDPPLLVLDEPAGGLDRADTDWLHATVRRLREYGTAVLYAGRRADDVLSVCDRIGVLDHGRLVGDRADLPAA